MIEPQAKQLAQKTIEVEIEDQNRRLKKKVTDIKSKMSQHGALSSGRTLALIAEACEEAITERVGLVWSTYMRFLSAPGLTYSEELADELFALVAEHIPEHLYDFNSIVSEEAHLIRLPQLATRFTSDFIRARNDALTKIRSEIGLFALNLRDHLQQKENMQPPAVSIYGNVGAVQTGEHAVAHVQQAIDSHTVEALTKALAELLEKLPETNETSIKCPKNDLIELIEDGQQELGRPQPNLTKLGSILPTIGFAIQTTASLRPAYAALKAGIAYLSIPLP